MELGSKLVSTITTIAIILLVESCASISAPQGGKKDTKAPVLLNTIPTANATNFRGKKIYLTFDEEIDASKLKDKIIIAPNYYGSFEVETSGKKLIINLKDSLKSNETYTIDFQDGIKDNHEGVNIKKYKLTFSTGPNIDSLNILGKVVDAFTKNKQKDLLVGLYNIKDTINPEKKKPSYKTYTDQFGAFNITNIKPGKYQIVAYNDLNKNNLLDIKNENLGFINDTISPSYSKDTLTIETSRNDIYKPKLLGIKNDTENELSFNEGLYKYQIESTEKLYYDISKEKKELIIYKTNLCEDSLNIKVTISDSSDNDTTYHLKITNNPPKKFKTIKNNLKTIEPEEKYQANDSLPIKLTFEYPIITDKDSAIICNNDSSSFKYLRLLKDFKPNTGNTEFTYTYKRRAKEYLQLIINSKKFFTLLGDTNQSYSHKYPIKQITREEKEDETYVTVNINTTTENYIVELLNEKLEVKEVDYNKPKLKYKNLKPGKYSFRLIEDKNKNKKWDAAKYSLKQQPEKVIVLKNYLEIRANWDIEDVDITF